MKKTNKCKECCLSNLSIVCRTCRKNDKFLPYSKNSEKSRYKPEIISCCKDLFDELIFDVD